ncbi:DUF2167 domain-containing protein [Paraburkholderia sp. ZP32-5]|uniref:DUF2167 domain-containing protein n=1 Tax=Paraburkholderia sp. ZP32-5 TaxID=2883245 RepID=UPI001F3804E5|nr:DUF2167 domain-containing protein [Paraburkholderia sp. ZP32-5]
MIAASEEFNQAALSGPGQISIFNEATLAFPASDKFVPASAAARLLRSMGQTVDDKRLVGMIMPDEADAKWVAIVTFI